MILIEVVDFASSPARHVYADFNETWGRMSLTPRLRRATQFRSLEEATEVVELYTQFLDDPRVQIHILGDVE